MMSKQLHPECRRCSEKFSPLEMHGQRREQPTRRVFAMLCTASPSGFCSQSEQTNVTDAASQWTINTDQNAL